MGPRPRRGDRRACATRCGARSCSASRTNLARLRAIVEHPAFAAGELAHRLHRGAPRRADAAPVPAARRGGRARRGAAARAGRARGRGRRPRAGATRGRASGPGGSAREPASHDAAALRRRAPSTPSRARRATRWRSRSTAAPSRSPLDPLAPGVFLVRQGERRVGSSTPSRDGGDVHAFWDGVAYTLTEEREGARRGAPPRRGRRSRRRCRAAWPRSTSRPAQRVARGRGAARRRGDEDGERAARAARRRRARGARRRRATWSRRGGRCWSSSREPDPRA